MKNGILLSSVIIVLFLCSCRKNNTNQVQPNSQKEVQDTQRTTLDPLNIDGTKQREEIDSSYTSYYKLTKEMAYEGVNNYCHNTFDWSVAEENPSIMYITMGEDNDSEYQIIFRSYTGTFINFYVDKTSGSTRMIEYVPTLDIKNEIGVINIFDYIGKDKQ